MDFIKPCRKIAGLILGIIADNCLKIGHLAVRRGARLEDARSQYLLGRMCLTGFQEQENVFRAKELLENAVAKDFAYAKIYLADMYINESKKYDFIGDLDERFTIAEKLFRDSTKLGSVNLGYSGLAYLAMNGYGTSKDIKKALRYLTYAANSGSIYASNKLGEFYLKGINTEKNYKLARKFFEKGAKKHNNVALYNLGKIYEEGLGIDANEDLAVKFLEEAVWEGNVEALYNLGKLYCENDRYDTEKGIKYLTKASDQGNYNAKGLLGKYYCTGTFVEIDYNKAFPLVEAAAINGDTDSQRPLGEMYFYGFGTTKDINKSIRWLENAAKMNNSSAQFRLGWIYVG